MGQQGDEDQLRRLCFFLYASWEIWKQRDDWIFNGEQRSTTTICQQVQAQVMERMVVELFQWQLGLSRVSLICWIPPPTNLIKASFDAAIWDDGGATVVL